MTHARDTLTGDQAQPPGYQPLRLGYLVARFPKTTETFVVRELNEVAAHPDIDARLYSLFPPADGAAVVHPSAQAWVERVLRPGLAPSMRATMRWVGQRPIRLTTTIAGLIWGFRHRPKLLVSSLGAMVIGCRLAEEMRDEGIEHVHAHFLGHPATAAWVIQRLVGIRYSVTAHAYELFQDNEFLEPRVRAASFVVTISQFNADFLSHHCNGNTPIYIVRAGITLKAFTFRERRLPEAGPIRMLAVGSLIEHKGHRILLQALAGSVPELERVRLTIVGEGSERAALEEEARVTGLSARVEFVGAKPEDEIARLMQESDLFVLPSLVAASGRMEGVPVVLMEAMASGLPVIASRLSGIPELVIDGETGILAEPGDAIDLRAKLIAALADPKSLQRMAIAARRRVEDEYDVRNSALRLTELFMATR